MLLLDSLTPDEGHVTSLDEENEEEALLHSLILIFFSLWQRIPKTRVEAKVKVKNMAAVVMTATDAGNLNEPWKLFPGMVSVPDKTEVRLRKLFFSDPWLDG